MQSRSQVVSSPAVISADARVVWIGGRPEDEDAHVVWDAITRQGLATCGAVIEWVGERLFRRDLERLGGAADIGFFQPFYRAQARQLLGRLVGTAVRIGRQAASP